MCNQHTFLFWGIPLFIAALIAMRRTLTVRVLLASAGFGIIGLLPYLYLPIASASSAAISWGDQTSVSGFLDHVLRRSYGSFSLGRVVSGGSFASRGTFFPALVLFLVDAVPRFAWIGIPFAIAGFFYAGHKDSQSPRKILFLSAIAGLYLILFCALANLSPVRELYRTEISRFFIQADFAIALVGGLGAAKLLQWLSSRWSFLVRYPRLSYALPILAIAVGVKTNGSAASRRNDFVFADFAKAALDSLPPNAILITVSDHVSGAISYFHEVEGLRPDVVHLDRELLSFPWYCQRKRRTHPELYLPEGGYGRRGWNVRQLLEGNSNRPVGVIPLLDDWDDSWTPDYKLAPEGLVHWLVRKDRFPNYQEWLVRDQQASRDYDVVPALRFGQGTWESALAQLVLTTQGVRAQRALAYSLEHGNDPIPARRCIGLFEDIIAKAGGEPTLGIAGTPNLPQLDIAPSVWRNLGICYDLTSHEDPSYLPRVGVAVMKFAERAKPGDPDLPAARKYLEVHRP
jgi:hypothetical protein